MKATPPRPFCARLGFRICRNAVFTAFYENRTKKQATAWWATMSVEMSRLTQMYYSFKELIKYYTNQASTNETAGVIGT